MVVMGRDVVGGGMAMGQDGFVVAVVGDGGQGFAAVAVHPEVGAFGNQGHTVVLDDRHFGAVHFAEDMGGDDAVGGPSATMAPLRQTMRGR